MTSENRATTVRLPSDLHDWLRRYVADRFPLTQNDVILMALRRFRENPMPGGVPVHVERSES